MELDYTRQTQKTIRRLDALMNTEVVTCRLILARVSGSYNRSV